MRWVGGGGGRHLDGTDRGRRLVWEGQGWDGVGSGSVPGPPTAVQGPRSPDGKVGWGMRGWSWIPSTW